MASSHQVILHIGAHKTATTHLQQALQGARADLRKEGVRVFGPSQLRGKGKTLAERFSLPHVSRPENAGDDAEAMLAEMLSGADRLVLTEENFVGVLNRNGSKLNVPLYPNAVERIAALGSVVAPDGIDLFLGIRGPAPFLNSVYSQVLLSGHAIKPAEFRSKNTLSDINWARYVERLSQITKIRSFIVWPFEDYAALSSRVVALMVGEKAAPLVRWIPDIVHSGLSTRAVEEILAGPRGAEAVEAARNAKSRFPISEEFPKFDVFTGKDHAISGVQYADQLKEIGQMANVTLLRA